MGTSKGTRSQAQTSSATLNIGGNHVQITNPDKMLFPEMGITKGRFMQELVRLSPYLLPACEGRYLTTIRYPDGVSGKFFYQKNAPEPTPPYVKTAVSEGISYVVLNDITTLLWLGNLACIEYHPSLHKVHDPLPTEWIIDLDPSVEEEPRIMEAASLVGDMLEQLGLRSVPKTSGATGVQIVIPIEQGPSFTQLKELGHVVAAYLCERHPKLFTIERFKKIAALIFISITCSMTKDEPSRLPIHREQRDMHPSPCRLLGMKSDGIRCLGISICLMLLIACS